MYNVEISVPPPLSPSLPTPCLRQPLFPVLACLGPLHVGSSYSECVCVCMRMCMCVNPSTEVLSTYTPILRSVPAIFFFFYTNSATSHTWFCTLLCLPHNTSCRSLCISTQRTPSLFNNCSAPTAVSLFKHFLLPVL